MKKIENLKLKDLTTEMLNVKELSNLKGGAIGIQPLDGCRSGICSQSINTSYCDGGAVCTSGIAG